MLDQLEILSADCSWKGLCVPRCGIPEHECLHLQFELPIFCVMWPLCYTRPFRVNNICFGKMYFDTRAKLYERCSNSNGVQETRNNKTPSPSDSVEWQFCHSFFSVEEGPPPGSLLPRKKCLRTYVEPSCEFLYNLAVPPAMPTAETLSTRPQERH